VTCDSGTNDRKIRVFKVTRPDYPGNSCTYRDAATAIDGEFDGAEPGDTIHITLMEMSEDELERLPEFEGW
jgi:hypothetical protein